MTIIMNFKWHETNIKNGFPDDLVKFKSSLPSLRGIPGIFFYPEFRYILESLLKDGGGWSFCPVKVFHCPWFWYLMSVASKAAKSLRNN